MTRSTIRIRGLTLLLALLLLFNMLLPGSAFRSAAEEPTPVLEIRYYNLSYSSQIYLMYAVAYENVDPAADEVRMLFWDEGRSDGYPLGTEARSVTANSTATIGGKKHLVFYSEGLAPKQLTDTVYCRACVTKGGTTYYSEPIKYSPIKYVFTVLDGSYGQADQELVSALRAYGAAAQARFNYHTERLASEDFCAVTLNGAQFDDGFSQGLYPAGTELTVTADVPAGQTFEAWKNGAGDVLGTQTTLTLTVDQDVALTAVCGTLVDYSAYAGKTFTAQTTELLPYFFTGGPLTSEAAVRVPTSLTGRGGVIVGSYESGTESLNFEIHNDGRPRVYLTSGKSHWDLLFDTDVRSDAVRHIAVTLGAKNGDCTLYLDGQAVETKTMPCSVPVLRDYLRLGGDDRSGNSQYFKGTVYALAIYEGVRSGAGIARDAVFGAERGSEALAASYRFVTANDRTDESRFGKDLRTQRPQGLTPELISDRWNLKDCFDTVPRTYEAVFETSADVFSNNKGCTIIGNYNDVYVPGITFRVYLNGRPSLCLRYDREHQDQFTFPASILGEGRVHVAITIDDTYVYGYLNGKQVLKKAHCGSFPELTPYPFSVGGDNRTDNTWWFRDGSIYSVNLFSEYRTAEQIRADVPQIDCSDPTLMVSYDFTQSQQDRSQNGNDLMPYLYERDFLSSDSYDYTFACIGDTQSVVKEYPDALHKIYDFILDHVDDMKIKFAIGLGDITEDNTADQWELTSEQIYRMDGVVPYTVVRGNHDLVARTPEAEATRTLMFGYYFDNDVYRRQFDDSYEGGVTNVYKRFTVCGIPYLLLSLDYGPDDDVLAWANDVCEQFPDDNVIISTHAFLFHDGTTLDAEDICPPSHGVGVNDCDVMWDEFVSLHENIVLVLCGHDPSNNIVVSKMTGVHGNTVTCCLIDPQHTDYYIQGIGLVTLLHFSNGGRTITIENYSTIQEKFYKTDNEIVIENVARVS